MIFRKFLVLICVAVLLNACDDGEITNSTPAPAALVRFVNAIVDTGTVDFRFVDQVENLPTFLGVPFRGSSGVYQRVIPGTRPVRIFPNSSTQALASIRLVDKSITLEADKRYTLVYAGRAAGNQDTLVVIEETALELPTPPAGSIAIRALHVAVGTGNVDVHIAPDIATTDTVRTRPDPIATATARITNVPYLAQTAYVNVPRRAPSDTLPLYTFGITPAGSSTLSFRARPNQPGAPSTVATVGPQPGVQIAGSVLTAVVFAAATPGTRSATPSANTSPSVVLLIDKALNP
jgi:hypothetical protein